MEAKEVDVIAEMKRDLSEANQQIAEVLNRLSTKYRSRVDVDVSHYEEGGGEHFVGVRVSIEVKS